MRGVWIADHGFELQERLITYRDEKVTSAGILAVQQQLDCVGELTHVECSYDRPFRFFVSYDVLGDVRISVIDATLR